MQPPKISPPQPVNKEKVSTNVVEGTAEIKVLFTSKAYDGLLIFSATVDDVVRDFMVTMSPVLVNTKQYPIYRKNTSIGF